MYSVQQALKKHLQENKLNFDIREENIREYAGDLTTERLKQHTTTEPVIFLFPQPSKPLGANAFYMMDLIIITKSDIFDKASNSNLNMQLSEKVWKYLEAYPFFKDDSNYWTINFEMLEVKQVAIDNKFAIVILGVNIGVQ